MSVRGRHPEKPDFPKLVIACPPNCSFHPGKIGEEKANLLKMVREAGHGQVIWMRRAAEILGHPVPGGNASRHLRHYREAAQPDEPVEDQPGAKLSDLEILDRIILAGARNSRNWKPTIGDTLKAMDMKLRLTGNSAWEDMLKAMEAGLAMAEDEQDVENPDAKDEDGA